MATHTTSALLVINALFFALGAGTSDGQWEEWSEWSSCGVSCGSGVQKRIRACSPPSRAGGKWCAGKYVATRECNTGARCPVDGKWSEWSPWGRCSVSCGQGSMERYRSCSSPIPEEGGKKCRGTPIQSESCFALRECPRDGGWSPWSQWSLCSVTCGAGGSVNKYRSCNNPPPVAEGRPCAGKYHETKGCEAPRQCPVNGQWSEWSEWSECSVSCGQGERRRQRACDHPPPQHGGADCDRAHAAELQTHSCSAPTLHCPVDGGWSGWSDWRECRSPNCGSTAAPLSLRHRSCNAPLPQHNGTMCEGVFVDAGLCAQPLNCKVDGSWGEWSAWNCTRFVGTRRRSCDSPAPSNGGKRCTGEAVQFFTSEEEAFREVCPQIPTDDEDLGEASGMQEASGAGNWDEE